MVSSLGLPHQPNSTLRKLIIPKSTKRVSRNELVAPLTWAQRRDGEPLKSVFERAAIGSILPSALGAAELCESSDGAAFELLIQT